MNSPRGFARVLELPAVQVLPPKLTGKSEQLQPTFRHWSTWQSAAFAIV